MNIVFAGAEVINKNGDIGKVLTIYDNYVLVDFGLKTEKVYINDFFYGDIKYTKFMYQFLLEREINGLEEREKEFACKNTNNKQSISKIIESPSWQKFDVHQKNSVLLNAFHRYLLKIGMTALSSNDYRNRVWSICHEEGISVEELIEKIGYYVNRYSVGVRKERGTNSHNAYKCSLQRFEDFLRVNE